MILPGVASVTFRKKTPREVIAITKKAGLSAIEWGSDVHVPQGALAVAREVRDMPAAAGLTIPSYGSYYNLGTCAEFEPFVESARALGAKNIRVWAGEHSHATIVARERERVIDDARRVSELAAAAGITVSAEFHNDSMNDSAEASAAFLRAVAHPNFFTYWQQPLELPPEKQLPELLRVLQNGRLTNIHIFQYRVWDGGREQQLLSDARELWRSFFDALRADGHSRAAFLEFVRNGEEEAFLADAQTLRSLLD